MPPVFSIITPVYHGEVFFERYFQCLHQQTFKDFEIILNIRIDKDDQEPLLKHEIQKLWEHQNILIQFDLSGKGQAFQRNQAANAAKGDYLALLDIDDEWLPNKLEEVHRELNANTYDVIHHGMNFIEKNKKTIPCLYPEFKVTFRQLLFGNKDILNSSSVIKRKIFLTEDGFKENIMRSEDWDLWLRLSFKQYRFKYIATILGNYYIHNNNLHKNLELVSDSYLSILSNHFQKLNKTPFDYILYSKKKSNFFYSLGVYFYNKKSFFQAQKFMLFSVLFFPINPKAFLQFFFFIFKKDVRNVLNVSSS